MKKKCNRFCWLVLFALCTTDLVWAQASIPAGRVNQDVSSPDLQRSDNLLKGMSLGAQPKGWAPTKDVAVLVKGFTFDHGSVVSDGQLQALVAGHIGKSLDFSALDRLADRISRYYRDKGYTVARVYLPAQAIIRGVVRFTVIEGHFGAINLKNSSSIQSEHLIQTITNNLCDVSNGKDCVGKLITDKGLERSILLLKDLPGITASVNLKPGTSVGTSELDVQITETKSTLYSVGVDNFGSPSTGTIRVNASVDLNNLQHIGDQLTLGVATTTLTQTKTGSASYSLPAGYAGQRVGFAFSRNQYSLGAGFSATQSHGVSNALSAYTSYPIVRSVNHSLYIRGAAEFGQGTNNVDLLGTSFKSHSNVARVGLNGDMVDRAGGYTVYGATLSEGHTITNDPSDSSTSGAHSAGRFAKLTYNLAHQRPLIGALTLYGMANAQRASKNLPGSEQIGLGGPNSVRGYSPEAGGSVGANGAVELRFTDPRRVGSELVNVTYGLFYDRAWVRFYEAPPSTTSATIANTRALGSYGLSLTIQSQAKQLTPASWGYFLKATYGVHPASQPSTIDVTSTSKFWLYGGLNF
jgi:hemolysin activation/secretion protein